VPGAREALPPAVACSGGGGGVASVCLTEARGEVWLAAAASERAVCRRAVFSYFTHFTYSHRSVRARSVQDCLLLGAGGPDGSFVTTLDSKPCQGGDEAVMLPPLTAAAFGRLLPVAAAAGPAAPLRVGAGGAC
jgi:hypothetical protein